MRLHLITSATVSVPERAVLRGGTWARVALPVRYGIIERAGAGPLLIDTGYGPRVTGAPGRSTLMRAYAAGLPSRPCGGMEPAAVLARLGYGPGDVAAVFVTHLHADHIARLDEFPTARIVTDAAALTATLAAPRWRLARHGIFPELLPADILARVEDIRSGAAQAAPLGLGQGHAVPGWPGLLAIALPGHARGHWGLCLPAGAGPGGGAPDKPLLYACDAQWHMGVLRDPARAPGFPAARVAEDAAAAAATTRRVAAFLRAGGAVALCHDPAPTPWDMPATPGVGTG